jgi:hypothetical protein
LSTTTCSSRAPGRVRRSEFEYRRGGTLAHLAAYDVHAARVLGRTAPTTGIVPFAELVEQVMSSEPYASAARVFWIVNNGSSHQGPHALIRMWNWPHGCWLSKTATTPPPNPSTGTSAASPSTTSSNGSLFTKRWPHDPRRFNGEDH